MTLPFNYQLMIYKTLQQIIPVSKFETWLYAETKLADYLPENVYLDLISLDFRDKHILHELNQLLADYWNKGEMWQWELMHILQTLIEQPNHANALSQIYDWYCDGCDFMRLLALRYGLEIVYNELPDYLTAENLAEIQQQAKYLLNALQNGEIQLFEDTSDDIWRIDYIDNRSKADKQQTDLI